MTKRDEIERRIRDVLANETHAMPLSNKLFTPEGLFSEIAGTEEERRVLVQSPLFRQALRRLHELENKEGAAFSAAIRQAESLIPEGGCVFKLEPARKS